LPANNRHSTHSVPKLATFFYSKCWTSKYRYVKNIWKCENDRNFLTFDFLAKSRADFHTIQKLNGKFFRNYW
jgi:hypothetical protein